MLNSQSTRVRLGTRHKGLRMQGDGGAASSPLLTGLAAYWKLDEASGTRVDATGRGNGLTDNNTVTQNPGKIANAAQFTAANSESLSRADNADLSMANISFTLAAWVYLDTAAGMAIAGKYQAGDSEYLLYDSGSRFEFICQKADNTGAVAVTANLFGAPLVSEWNFVVGWLDMVGNTINIQVNNGAINSVADTFGVRDGTALFAMGTYSGANYFNGRIDEVGLWKRVLTVAERTSLYNGGAGLTYPF